MLNAIKLSIGRLANAWYEYPETRRALQDMPEGPPIFVTGTHRSGTTWVARMLAVPGMWYLHEPFNPNKGLWNESFIYVAVNGSEQRVDTIMEALLRGELRQVVHHPRADHWLMPVRLFPQPIHRILIKDPIACLMSEYLTNKFGMKTIVLFRHPAGFVHSILKLGWPCCVFIQRFLACEPLMHDWLWPYRNALESVKSKEGVEAATTLHGCLNTVLWGYVSRNPNMTAISFEDLCSSPIERFQALFRQLDLPYNEAVRDLHVHLSLAENGGPNDYRAHEVRRNSRVMAYHWKDQLSPEQIKQIRSVWEKFNIPLYQSDSVW